MKLAGADEVDVLPQIASGDVNAVRTCVERYGAMVYGMSRRFLRDPSSADDATQDIFIELWKSAAKFDRATARESTFIITIARRRLIDRLRRMKSRPQPDSLEVVSEPLAGSIADRVEQNDLLVRATQAMNQLPADQRRVLELSIGNGLTYTQIAERTNAPLGTVKSHARRGLIRLREMLDVQDLPEQSR